MCPPVIAAAAAGVSAIGTVIGGVTAMQQGKYRARVAERNAEIEREQIVLEQERGRREALNHYRKVAQLKGQQRAAAAANGVSTNFGTAADIITDTNMMAREDVANIYGQTNENVKDRDRRASNFMGEASSSRSAGRSALVGSLFQAGSTALGGASQYKQLKAEFG